MKTILWITALVLVLGSLVAGNALAEVGENDKPLVSVTPYLGHGNWDTDLNVDDSFIYGGRAAFHFLRWLSVEGSYGRSSSSFSDRDWDVDMTHMGVDLVAELFPNRKFNPYVTAGWAQLNHDGERWETEYLNGWEAGVGAKIRLGGDNANYRALRIEVRDVVSDFSEVFANHGDSKHNILTTVGLQFAFGKSSKDSDGDGVRDREDACADTPAGARIDASGCPTDSDGDGVYDGLDRCDGTPADARVDAHGCPMDSDGDGVLDGLDRCGDTPEGARVDASGCPTDSDGDGVFDGIDQCEGTESNLQVDMNGCPIAVTEIEEQLLDTGSISTSSIVFASGSADLDLKDTTQLDEVGEALSHWPELRIEIGGYTDSSGRDSFNQQLSEKRAQAVLDYLVANFPQIVPAQYSVVGYGEAQPVADNATAEGRAANRRVEFKVLNTEELKKQIEKRRMLER